MAISPRAFRRLNPITLLLLLVGVMGFVYFIFSPSADSIPDMTRRIGQQGADKISQWAPSHSGVKHVAPPVIHYQMNNLVPSTDPVKNRETVLILTPMSKFYSGYWDNLLKLSYPRELVSLGFIIPQGREGNAVLSALNVHVQRVQSTRNRFKEITIMRQDTESPLRSQSEKERHKLENQTLRRASMSKARNSLLFTTLGPDNVWVLWLDADIVETPATLIQDLASHDKPVIVANCYQKFYNSKKSEMDMRPYDFNSWVDSDIARSLGERMGYDEVLYEGYSEMATYRTLLAYLAEKDGDPRKVVELDGVGGTALLVKSDVHRDGAMFPPFAFYHLIETEGFAKMASRLGWQSYGLPNYFVYHYNE